MRVLVADDEVRLADMIGRGLSVEGFLVEIAHDGPAAVAMATARAYDAIVLDIMLPGLSGYRVCEQLRAAGVWTPILMLTAKTASTTRWTPSTWARTTT
ncbi:MAG: response regulator [Geodermatophilaceae bacterium]